MKKLLFLLLFPFLGIASPQGVPGETTTVCGTSNGVLLAANPNRAYVIFQNQGSDATGHCHVKAGSPITGTEGLWVNQNQNMEPVEAFIKQAFYCKCDSAAQTFEILYSNY